jgi:hypothetical protein
MSGSNAKIKSVQVDEALLTVWLDDGRIVSVPLAWYPSLVAATPAVRKAWQPSGAGRAVHGPALDYDLSIEGLLAGRKEHPNALRYVTNIPSGCRRAQGAHGFEAPRD